MRTRKVLFAPSMAIVCLLISPPCSNRSLAQQSADAPAVLDTSDDLQPLEDPGSSTRDTPTAVDPPRFFAERSPVPSRSVLRTNEDQSDVQSQNPENPNTPQPLDDPPSPGDPQDLRLPRPAPIRVESTSPAPLHVDVSSEVPPSSSAEREYDSPSDTSPRTRAEVNLTSAVPVIAIETVSPAEVNVGRTVKYVIAVRNRGDVAAENLKVIATLPEQVELIEAAPPATHTGDGELHFDIGNLGPRESRLIELQLVPHTTGAIQLATRASLSVSTHAAMHVRRPQLALTCEAPEEAQYGDKVTFVLVVANTGDGAAKDVVITSQLPSHALPDDKSEQSKTVGRLGPGESLKVPVTASAIGPGLIEAQFTATDASGSEANARAKVRVRRAVIEVAADGPRTNFLGREAVYEIRVSNPGDAPAENVEVVASLPSGLQLTVLGRPVDFDRHTNTMTWHVESLAAGVTERLPFKLKAMAEGEQVQEITASADRGLRADTRYQTRVSSRPKINVAIAGKDGPLAVGDAAEFQVEVQNVGTKAAEGIHVKVVTPDALQAVISDDYAIDGNQLTFSPLTLAAGQTKTLRFRAVGREAGDHIVHLVVESEAPRQSLSAETSAFFYSSQDDPRITSVR